MGPDYRVIVKHARHEAAAYKQRYGEDIPTEQLVQTVAEIFQVFQASWVWLQFIIKNYTQQGGVRVFGISLLIIGFDSKGPMLYQCDPSGCFYPWKATALGKDKSVFL